MGHEEIMSDLQSPNENKHLDLVNVVRCRDCKYWMRAYLSISGKHGCNVMRDYTAPDDYCFKAERKA